ncbi:MAG: betaine--homocysteine S-methyltransferase [Pseudomonadota bacterium]
MSNPLYALIEEKGVLLADGATGTNLFEMGLEAGGAPELWNDELPDNITNMHQNFVDSGSDIILTNSFGGTRHRLKLHKAEDRVHELNKKAAIIARNVADAAPKRVIVAGSVGPTGELLVPLGSLSYEDCVKAFCEQMEGLKDGGADVIWIETMSSPDEIKAAAEAASIVEMPYVVTASFDTAGRTMMGLPPEEFPDVIDQDHKPVAVGANCGVGASDLLSSVLDMTAANPGAIVVAKANCGIPQFKGDTVEYSGNPDLMHEYTKLAIDAGARIVGGCCGTSYAHLRAMRQAIDTHTKANRPALDIVVEKIGPLVNKPAASNNEQESKQRKRRRRS